VGGGGKGVLIKVRGGDPIREKKVKIVWNCKRVLKNGPGNVNSPVTPKLRGIEAIAHESMEAATKIWRGEKGPELTLNSTTIKERIATASGASHSKPTRRGRPGGEISYDDDKKRLGSTADSREEKAAIWLSPGNERRKLFQERKKNHNGSRWRLGGGFAQEKVFEGAPCSKKTWKIWTEPRKRLLVRTETEKTAYQGTGSIGRGNEGNGSREQGG